MTRKTEDKLNRTDFVHFIENLVINSHNYKRNNDANSYVMALDSAWGTGKSHFLKLLEEDIEENHKNIKVVKYNAWENDYCDNAFNPLIYDVLKSDALGLNTEDKADFDNIKKLLSSVAKIGISLGKQFIKKKVETEYGLNVEEAIDEAIKAKEPIKDFMFKVAKNLEDINSERKNFDVLKECLNKAVENVSNVETKLLIIIDELDRCKPTFAIETLEIVKHIFDINNVVFLFTIDIQQLSHSISSVYGQGFDSVGYLCRFFDYIAKLPTPNVSDYVKWQFESIDTIPNSEHMQWSLNIEKEPLKQTITTFITTLSSIFAFSLRDLDTVIQSYKIMLDSFLSKYIIPGAHMVYIFYLSLKYKYPEIFYEIFIKSPLDTQISKNHIRDILNASNMNNPWISDTIGPISVNTPLKDLYIYPCCDFNGKRRDHISKVRISYIQDTTVYAFHEQLFPSSHKPIPDSFELNPFECFGNIIFYPDLLNWEKIKHLSYREYIHQQLESFNFIDETKF